MQIRGVSCSHSDLLPLRPMVQDTVKWRPPAGVSEFPPCVTLGIGSYFPADCVCLSFFSSMQRKREKRPVTVGGRRFLTKNAVQIVNRLDRLVQLHVAKIGGRTLVASPTAMQVLHFVTLVDATGREHPIFMECCASFQVRNAARICCMCVRVFADDVGPCSNCKRC